MRETISDLPWNKEFIESNYFLYMATKDTFYLEVAEMVLDDLSNRTVKCGIAGLRNVNTPGERKDFFLNYSDIDLGDLDDRMPSYFLAETLK
jgi:ER degradation enhancer, mannosidase alpha-like 1